MKRRKWNSISVAFLVVIGLNIALATLWGFSPEIRGVPIDHERVQTAIQWAILYAILLGTWPE